MKILKIRALLLVAMLAGMWACEPIENRGELENSFSPDDIDLAVVQDVAGTNKLSIQMNTPGVTGYWDYILDTKYTDRVEVIFPFTGTHTFTYHATTPYINNGDITDVVYVEKTIDVTVEQLDNELPEAYYLLVGQELEGKEWVFDGGPASDGGLWWFMSDPTNPWGIWWNAAGDCCPPVDAAGKMKFDLNGGQNYSYWSDAANAAEDGMTSFAFNSDYTKITLNTENGINLLGSVEGGGNGGTFDIVELTDEKMVLFVPNAAWATGWTWVFKPVKQ